MVAHIVKSGKICRRIRTGWLLRAVLCDGMGHILKCPRKGVIAPRMQKPLNLVSNLPERSRVRGHKAGAGL